MKKSRSQELRAVVKARLIPHIYSCDFQDDERKIWNQDPYGHQSRRFLQWDKNKLELLEIQFDKHGRGAFVFNFGVVPPGGVESYGKHLLPEETAVMHLEEQARLYESRAWRMQWFGFPRIRIPIVRNPSAEQIVNRAISLFSQIEAWFENGVRGPNIRVTYRNTGTAVSRY